MNFSTNGIFQSTKALLFFNKYMEHTLVSFYFSAQTNTWIFIRLYKMAHLSRHIFVSKNKISYIKNTETSAVIMQVSLPVCND